MIIIAESVTTAAAVADAFTFLSVLVIENRLAEKI